MALRKGSSCLCRVGRYKHRVTLLDINELARTARVRFRGEELEVKLKQLRPLKHREQPAPAPRRLPQIDPQSPGVTARVQGGGGVPQPKALPRLAAPVYLAYVRRLPCCSCLTEGDIYNPVQAHHQGPRGVGEKAGDAWAVPLCAACHEQLHHLGQLPGRTPAATREHVLRTQAANLLCYLQEQQPQPAQEGERLRLLRQVVGMLEGELRQVAPSRGRRAA